MRIAIPTNDGKTVSEHFGRSNYFFIYDSETKEKKLIDNPHKENIDDRVGHALLLKSLLNEKIDKVICYNLGMKMMNDLNKVNIGVEFSNEISIEKIIKQL